MNYRIQKTKDLEFELSLIKGTTPELGKTVPCSVRRISDGFWWDAAGGGSFPDATYRTNNMTELTGNDGVEARYKFLVPATNLQDTYQFRARFQMTGDTADTLFEVEVETYSELTDAPRQHQEALPGGIVRLSAFLQDGGIAITGKTLGVSLQRQSDGRWWTGTGAIFQLGHRTVPLTEQTGNVAVEGEYTRLFTVPPPMNEVYHWSVKYNGPPAIYIKGLIRTADANIYHVDGDRDAAISSRAALSTVTRGKAVAGTLTSTEMTTDLTETTVNHYRLRAMYWENGPLEDQQTQITAYDGAGKLSFRQVTDVPLPGNKFVIV